MPAFFCGEKMSERSFKAPTRHLSSRREAADRINRAFARSEAFLRLQLASRLAFDPFEICLELFDLETGPACRGSFGFRKSCKALDHVELSQEHSICVRHIS